MVSQGQDNSQFRCRNSKEIQLRPNPPRKSMGLDFLNSMKPIVKDPDINRVLQTKAITAPPVVEFQIHQIGRAHV
jgi:hypothetical protein